MTTTTRLTVSALHQKSGIWEARREVLARNRPTEASALRPPSTRYYALEGEEMTRWANDALLCSQSMLRPETSTAASRLQYEIDRSLCFLSPESFRAFKLAYQVAMHALAQELFPHPQNASEPVLYGVDPHSIQAYDEFPAPSVLPKEIWVMIAAMAAATAGDERASALSKTCSVLHNWLGPI